MKLLFLSDTHTQHRQLQNLPAADVLIHGGDGLITHCPPFGILDLEQHGEHIGCTDLLKTVQEIKPKFHLFGHVHESYGIEHHEKTTFINGSVLNKKKEVVNKPIIIEIIK